MKNLSSSTLEKEKGMEQTLKESHVIDVNVSVIEYTNIIYIYIDEAW